MGAPRWGGGPKRSDLESTVWQLPGQGGTPAGAARTQNGWLLQSGAVVAPPGTPGECANPSLHPPHEAIIAHHWTRRRRRRLPSLGGHKLRNGVAACMGRPGQGLAGESSIGDVKQRRERDASVRNNAALVFPTRSMHNDAAPAIPTRGTHPWSMPRHGTTGCPAPAGARRRRRPPHLIARSAGFQGHTGGHAGLPHPIGALQGGRAGAKGVGHGRVGHGTFHVCM